MSNGKGGVHTHDARNATARTNTVKIIGSKYSVS